MIIEPERNLVSLSLQQINNTLSRVETKQAIALHKKKLNVTNIYIIYRNTPVNRNVDSPSIRFKG